MEEITQKNIILIGTCIIVICFHFAYKFRSNLKTCNILIGIGFFISLLMTKLLHGWEKENKVDYNLVLFLFYLVDLILFLFLIYRYYDIKGKMVGGGVNQVGEPSLIDEFKKQDFLIKGIAESPISGVIGDKIKDRLTNYIVNILSRIRI